MGEFCGGIPMLTILASSIKSGAPPIHIHKSGPSKKRNWWEHLSPCCTSLHILILMNSLVNNICAIENMRCELNLNRALAFPLVPRGENGSANFFNFDSLYILYTVIFLIYIGLTL